MCCHAQQRAAEAPLKAEADEAAMGEVKPERQRGIDGWRAALTAWQGRASEMLVSHNAKARVS